MRKFPQFLRIAVVPNPYFIVLNETGDGNYIITGGPEGELIKICSQALNFSYKLVPATDGWGTIVNGKMIGGVGIVFRNEADIGITRFGDTESRRQYVDYSYPYTLDDFTFVTQKPTIKFSADAILRPFAFKLWLTIIISIVILSLIFSYFQKKGIIKSMLQVFGILISQSLQTSLKNKTILSAWTWGSLFLSYCYVAVLLSFLTVPMVEKVPENFEELAEAVTTGTDKVMTYKGSLALNELLMSERKAIKIIAEHIEKNDNLISPRRETIIEALRGGKTALISPRTIIKLLVQDEFLISKDTFKALSTGVIISKTLCCKDEIDKFIHILSASGIYENLIEKAIFKTKLTSKGFEYFDALQVTARSLSLTDLYGAFVLIVLGHALAIIVALAEILHFKINSKQIGQNYIENTPQCRVFE